MYLNAFTTMECYESIVEKKEKVQFSDKNS